MSSSMRYGNESTSSTAQLLEVDCAYSTDGFFMAIVRLTGGTVITLMGIILNIFNIIILRKQPVISISIQLIIYLAYTDIVFLICRGIREPLRYWVGWAVEGDFIFRQKVRLYPQYRHIPEIHYVQPDIYLSINFLRYATHVSRNWLTVLISVERFLSLAFPFYARAKITKRRVLCAHILTSMIISSVYLPHIYGLAHYTDVTGYDTCNGRPVRGMLHTFNIWDRWLSISYTYLNPAIKEVLPFTIIAILNIYIVGKVRRISRNQKKMTAKENEFVDSMKAVRLTVAISVVFLVFELPSSFQSYQKFIGLFVDIPKIRYHGPTKNVQRFFAELFPIADSSANFVIYCLVNKQFRQTAKKLLNRR
ncbi:sex peptide receptor-related protein 2-like [Tubulanus polymorphus]|uniref:sex peptide receptor-related protein 2-like n=1 Tax=Tubulanus polymorphus TaxID=672921 RepID=UPI003DA38919